MPRTLHSSKQFRHAFLVNFAHFVLPLSNGCVTGDRSTETNDRISGCTVLFSIEHVALFETVPIRILRKICTLCFASVKWLSDRGSKHQNKRSNFRLHRPSSHRKKMNQILKTIGRRIKRLCVRWRSEGSTQPEKTCRSKSTNQYGVRSADRTDLCFSICRRSKVLFIVRAQPHAQSLFSTSNSFWY